MSLDPKTIERIFGDVKMGLEFIDSVVTLTGFASHEILGAMAVKLPPLAEGGEDIATEYDKARAEALGDTEPPAGASSS